MQPQDKGIPENCQLDRVPLQEKNQSVHHLAPTDEQTSKHTSTCYPPSLQRNTLYQVYEMYAFRGGGVGFRKPGMKVQGFRALIVDSKVYGEDNIRARREAELVASTLLSKSKTSIDFDQFLMGLEMIARRIPWSQGNKYSSPCEQLFAIVSQLVTENPHQETTCTAIEERIHRNKLFQNAMNALSSLIEKNGKAFQLLYRHYLRRDAYLSGAEHKVSGQSQLSINDMRRFAQDFDIFPHYVQLETLRETLLDTVNGYDERKDHRISVELNSLEEWIRWLVMIAYYAFGDETFAQLHETQILEPRIVVERLYCLFRLLNACKEKKPSPPMPVDYIRFKDSENRTPLGHTPRRIRKYSITGSPIGSDRKKTWENGNGQ
ncbi:hypothetical protein GAYE_SCF25G4459 [Galdieria yellowstonensis]|uniref:Uncharacterized protein n=1 Tax=Galdieria yellowstonensis TaxID=3028027 RepID=A0AAV9IGX9_9RHOD|nr:hypothetical protein GAYE_SCF25G4459 [Galdieria yellowstonensis]